MIEEAKKFKYIDTCIVSNKDEEIKKIAENCGVNVPFFCVSATEPDHSPYWMYTLGEKGVMSGNVNFFV